MATLNSEVHYRLRASAMHASALDKLVDITGGQRDFTRDELAQIASNARQLQKLHAEMADDLAYTIECAEALATDARSTEAA